MCLLIFVIISGVKLKYLSSPSVGLTHSIMSALFWQEPKLVNVWAAASWDKYWPGSRSRIAGEFACCSTTISSLYLCRFQLIITDIVCCLSISSSSKGASLPLSRLVTLLGRENKLISSKVDIDAEQGREGRIVREGEGWAWNLSNFWIAKYVALRSGYWRD